MAPGPVSTKECFQAPGDSENGPTSYRYRGQRIYRSLARECIYVIGPEVRKFTANPCFLECPPPHTRGAWDQAVFSLCKWKPPHCTARVITWMSVSAQGPFPHTRQVLDVFFYSKRVLHGRIHVFFPFTGVSPVWHPAECWGAIRTRPGLKEPMQGEYGRQGTINLSLPPCHMPDTLQWWCIRYE